MLHWGFLLFDFIWVSVLSCIDLLKFLKLDFAIAYISDSTFDYVKSGVVELISRFWVVSFCR